MRLLLMERHFCKLSKKSRATPITKNVLYHREYALNVRKKVDDKYPYSSTFLYAPDAGPRLLDFTCV